MHNKDLQDLLGGLLMLAIGTFAAIYAYLNLDFGSLRSMGPGFFPLVLGSLLAIFGLLIALPALFRKATEAVEFDSKALFFITLTLVLFAFLLHTLGVLLTSFVAALVATVPLKAVAWKTRALTALGVALITWVVFVLGLGMNLPVWPWSH